MRVVGRRGKTGESLENKLYRKMKEVGGELKETRHLCCHATENMFSGAHNFKKNSLSPLLLMAYSIKPSSKATVYHLNIVDRNF